MLLYQILVPVQSVYCIYSVCYDPCSYEKKVLGLEYYCTAKQLYHVSDSCWYLAASIHIMFTDHRRRVWGGH